MHPAAERAYMQFVNLFTGLLVCRNDETPMRIWTVVRNGRSIRRLKSVAAFERRPGACRLTVEYFAVERTVLDHMRSVHPSTGCDIGALHIAWRLAHQTDDAEIRTELRSALRRLIKSIEVELQKDGTHRSGAVSARLFLQRADVKETIFRRWEPLLVASSRKDTQG